MVELSPETHKHKLKLVRIPGVTYRFRCVQCERRFTFLRSPIRRMLQTGGPFKPNFFMGAW